MLFSWDFDPIFFTIPYINLSVRWYGLMFAGGFLIGYCFVRSCFKAKNLKTDLLDSLLFFMFAGTIIGARLGHCFFYDPNFYLNNPLEILMVWHGGLASHGGGIGLVCAVLLFCRLNKLNFIPLADLLCIPTAFVGGMIRLGNFFNSEIFGKPTGDDNFGVIFQRLNEQVPIPRHPVQLYESFIYILITITLWFFYKKTNKNYPGLVLGLFLVLIFTGRIFLETLKPEQASYMNSDELLTVGQWLSIPFIISGIILCLLSVFGKNKTNEICKTDN